MKHFGTTAPPTETEHADLISQGFIMRARVRAISGGAVAANIPIQYANPYEDLEYWFNLTLDGDGDAVVEYAASGNSYNTGSSGYVLYEAVFDPDTQTLDLFVDGVEALTDLATTSTNVDFNRFMFGDGHSAGAGEANYNLVELELIPEPTTLALLALGGVAAMLRRPRRRT